MALKVYRARSMNDALAEVKRDLGPDAVILHTRNYKSGGLLGWGAKPVVEITASTDENPPTRRALPERPRGRAQAARAPHTPAHAATNTASNADAADLGSDPLAGLIADLPDKPQQPAQHNQRRPYPAAPTESVHHEAERTTRDAPESADRAPSQIEPRFMAVAPSRQIKPSPPEDDIQSIKRMVARLLQTSAASPASTGAMTDPLFEHYLKLQENAVATEIADDIVGRVRDELSSAELTDQEIVRETMLRHIAGLIPSSSDAPRPARPADDRPRTIALIGPTGVGKTTTVAKLAATSKLRHGRSVGLITADTYRIAAVEQLRTYADIIGLPLKVVASPADMRPALDSMAHLDEILIDTAGRSQHDHDRLTELRTYLDAADPHETHLVLSSVASEAVLLRAAENFAPLRPNRLIVTKLDEAVNFGVLLGVIRRVGASLSYVTMGQEVPDHIEAGKPDRLARMILTGGLPE